MKLLFTAFALLLTTSIAFAEDTVTNPSAEEHKAGLFIEPGLTYEYRLEDNSWVASASFPLTL